MPNSPERFAHHFYRDLQLAPSPIHGTGVFAKRSFKKGEVIIIMQGHMMPDTVYPAFINEFPDLDNTICRYSGDYVMFYEEYRQTNLDNFINHANAPNAFFHCGSIFALQNIDVGEEITADYQYLLTEYEQIELPNGEIIRGMDGRTAMKLTAQILIDVMR